MRWRPSVKTRVQMSDGTLYSVSFYREQGGDSLVLGMKASEGAILSKSQSIQDAGIASCVSGPRLAHVFLWYWFDGPGVKKARRGAESEEEHQLCDGSTLKRIPRCRPCPGVDAPLLKARVRLEIHIASVHRPGSCFGDARSERCSNEFA